MKGIYLIKNIINNKMYIGLSVDIEARTRHHKWALKKNCHENFHLQNAWNKYGDNNFIFEIVEKFDDITLEELAQKEIYYIKKFNSYHNGYNRSLGGEGTENFTWTEEQTKRMSECMKGNRYSLGIKRSQETKIKLSQSFKKRSDLKEHSERGRRTMKKLWETKEFQQKLSQLNKGNKYALGMKLSEEHKQILSQIQKGENNSFYGKTHSEKSRKKMSVKSKQRWKNEEYRNKIRNKMDAIMKTEEYKNKISLACKGDKNGNSSVKEIDAIKIRLRYLNGEKPKKILVDYPMLSESGLKKICYCNTWKYIPNNIKELEHMLINYQS